MPGDAAKQLSVSGRAANLDSSGIRTYRDCSRFGWGLLG